MQSALMSVITPTLEGTLVRYFLQFAPRIGKPIVGWFVKGFSSTAIPFCGVFSAA